MPARKPCTHMFMRLAVLATTAVLLRPSIVSASESQEITQYLPGLVEDTTPADFGSLELQLGTGFARYPGHLGTAWTLAPEFKLGVAPNLEVSLATSYDLGTTSSANSGTEQVGFIYRFNKPSGLRPSFAVEGDYGTAFGVGREIGQTTLIGVMTQGLGRDPSAPQLDLNASWYHVTNHGTEDRADRYSVGLALAQALRSDLGLVTELYHAQRQDRRQAETIADIGLLYLLGNHWELGGSVGAGIGRYSPAAQVLFGIQHSFRVF